MRLMRRSKFQKIALCSIICLFIVMCYLLIQVNEIPAMTKINRIERSIRSPVNQAECRHPHLPIDNPEIMKFYKPVNKINCDNNIDWVMCDKSICFVKPEIYTKYGEITCSYTDLIRKSDFRVRYGRTLKMKEPYVLQVSDFVRVVCRSQSGKSWLGLAYGIRDGVQRPIATNFAPNILAMPPEVLVKQLQHDEPLAAFYNILMLGFDSLSRNAFIRKLPKTYSYLMEQLQASVLKGYNIVGDGTPQALVPLLTGYTELELPETRKRMPNAISVDAYPMIWKEYARLGYMTSFNEDLPNVGTFTYRMKGFNAQPVDHYMRTYYMEVENNLMSNLPNCVGNVTDHVIMLDYTLQFMLKYKESPRFVFSFHGGLSHDSINLIGAADDDVHNWLVKLKELNILENTILIIMSDHGNRFADVRATLQGKQEERLPFFSFTFPNSFKTRFVNEYNNFVANAERLTTPFDVHATLKHIIKLQTTQLDTSNTEETNYNAQSRYTDAISADIKVMPEISKLARTRATSLFAHILSNRSCADAYIEPHWCACLNWQTLELNDTRQSGTLLVAANSIVQAINEAVSRESDCMTVILNEIKWALRLLPHKELLQYKTNADLDGYLPDMTDNTNVNEIMYQLQIVTMPGRAMFEASVIFDVQVMRAKTKLSDISRINRYGKQANCIYHKNPELRKFCYCRN